MAESDVVHEVTVKLDEKKAPDWAGMAPPGEVRPLDALHHMLHEASALVSHVRLYQEGVQGYATASNTFFDHLRDFMASSGGAALYENALTPDGIAATQAAAAAASAAETGFIPPEASAAAGLEAASPPPPPPPPPPPSHPIDATATPSDATATPTTPATPTGSSQGATAFGPGASVARLPLLGAAGVSGSGVVLCPGAPGTAALGVKGGLTQVVPSELTLPTQHAALFSTEQQRLLVTRASDGLSGALKGKLMPTLQLWLDTYEECKAMLPQVERLRATHTKAQSQLDSAMGQVVAAEASAPLTTPASLEAVGVAVPRVLVRGSEGTMLTAQPAEGGSDAAAAASGAATAGGGDLVAVPAVKERREMYNREQAETDAALSFELSEVVLRDRLRWLVSAGAGLKALLAAGLAHSLRGAAAMGEPGQAGGGTTAGQLRAPLEELLTPFPAHVLARLRGDHLPLLPDLVKADHARLSRWAARYKAAMAAQAAATAAAAGAQMMAAAAGAGGEEGTFSYGSAAAAGDLGDVSVGSAEGKEALHRTDKGVKGGAAAGTAAVLPGGQPSSSSSSEGEKAPAGSEEKTAAAAAAGVGSGGVGGQLARAAAESGLPLELLAAAVAADVQEQEEAAAQATKGEAAWRLLHDGSVTVGKEQAVLLPEMKKAVGGVLPGQLVSSHSRITDALAAMSHGDPSTPSFDLAVLEVVEAMEGHSKLLETEILPALSESDSKSSLRSLAGAYRRAAATAPTRPHSWLLNTDAGTSSGGGGIAGGQGGRSGRWVAAAMGAAGRAMKAPVRAGVALADAAADAAH